MITKASSQLSNHRRRGAVTVEFAMVATVVFMVIFGLIEFARLSILRHAVDNAAYEAARVGIVPGATTAEVNNAAEWMLANSGVSPTQISVTPFPLNDDSESITVSVAVDVADNSWIPPLYTRGKSVVGEATLGTERYRGFNPDGS